MIELITWFFALLNEGWIALSTAIGLQVGTSLASQIGTGLWDSLGAWWASIAGALGAGLP